MGKLKAKKKNGLLYFRNFSRAVKARFKARCALSGHDMQDVVRELLEAYCLNNNEIRDIVDDILNDQVRERAGR